MRGRVVTELERFEVTAYRERIVGNYRLIYRVEDRGVLVLAVFDGRRDLEQVLINRLLTT